MQRDCIHYNYIIVLHILHRPLPEDLFSGLDDLSLVTQPSAVQASSPPAPSSTAPALNPLEAPLEYAVPGGIPPKDPYAPVDPFSTPLDLPGGASAAQPAGSAAGTATAVSGEHVAPQLQPASGAAVPSQRKKKVASRCGLKYPD